MKRSTHSPALAIMDDVKYTGSWLLPVKNPFRCAIYQYSYIPEGKSKEKWKKIKKCVLPTKNCKEDSGLWLWKSKSLKYKLDKLVL